MPRFPALPCPRGTAFLALSALASGCTAVEPTDSAQSGGEGGFVLFRANHEGMVLDVDLFASASGGDLPDRPAADGTCQVTSHADAGSVPIQVVGLDLGPTIALTGPSDFTAQRASSDVDYVLEGANALFGAEKYNVVHDGALYGYGGGVVGTFGFDQTFTLTNEGSMGGLPAGTLATFDVPGSVDPGGDYTDGTLFTPGRPATIAWTGGDGAQAFHVFVDGPDASADCYADPSETSFEIPGDVTQAVGQGGYAVVAAQITSDIDVGGRLVHLVVLSDYLD